VGFQTTSIGEKIGSLCSFVNGLPHHLLIIGAFQKVGDIKTRVINLPTKIGDKICELLPDPSGDD
jgi:hypothetical protein